jgi:hypothetical protein
VLLVLLVLERSCLQKRHVNPTRSAFPELHPPRRIEAAHMVISLGMSFCSFVGRWY